MGHPGGVGASSEMQIPFGNDNKKDNSKDRRGVVLQTL
jgi:hypothetical protein